MKTLPLEIQDHVCSYTSLCNVCKRLSIKKQYIYCDHICYYIHKRKSIRIVNTSLFLLIFSFLYLHILITVLLSINLLIAIETLF